MFEIEVPKLNDPVSPPQFKVAHTFGVPETATLAVREPVNVTGVRVVIGVVVGSVMGVIVVTSGAGDPVGGTDAEPTTGWGACVDELWEEPGLEAVPPDDDD
jgi:hypothetical protein